ncbi:hypothetical protein [Mycolicibacterium neoaurum]|uniref:FHA domain-containing protein n=1 Tax=Mycolicibacterium neoaurum TaxID=1795 RepID=A0AAV2WJN2_MYCNE|nr:hypothetical protein [Mycolicibacterium neoaurum]CDQ44489.1 hypothetical protein BN1047_02368 [Mycolicibacterium neoaurum]
MITERGLSALRLAVASALAGMALTTAGLAGAEPAPVPPGQPLPPGQPVVLGPGEMPVAAPAPPPVGAPPVPEISNPVYGQGQTPGAGGYIRDLWRAFQTGNPMDALVADPSAAPGGAPPGAGPAPKLPPGYTSLTDPASSTPALERAPGVGGPPLPPGFVSLSDPAPPADVLPIGAPGAAPADVPHPAAPTPPPAPVGPPPPPMIIANQ